jgi:signal transduction histidine kinase
MTAIVFLDALTLVFSLTALWAAFRARDSELGGEMTQPLMAFLILFSFSAASNVLEWSGLVTFVDVVEDYLEILGPLLWYFFIMLMVREGLNRVVRQQNRELSSLYELSLILSETHDSMGILRESLIRTLKMFDLEAGAVFLLDAGPGGETEMVMEGFEDNLTEIIQSFPTDSEILTRALESQELIIWNLGLPQVEKTGAELAEAGFKILVVVPIICQERSIGVIALTSRRERLLSREEINLMKLVASQLGVSMTVARLYREVSLQAVKMKEALARKTDMQSIVAHDLRTPIAVIMGYSDIIEREVVDPDTEDFRQMVHTIRKRAGQLDRLIGDFLDLSRLEAGKLVVRPEVLEPEKHLKEIVQETREIAAARGISLILNIEEPIKPVRADHDRFHQIFNNLVDNAVKYTPEGGRITISAGTEGALGKFVVEDTGVGIPDDEKKSVFEKFYRVPFPRGDRDQGSGLGLSISREFVELMGGKMWVEDSPAKGSRFWLTLPVAGEVPAGTGTPSTAEAGQDEETGIEKEVSILVLDDDRDFTGMVSRLLSGEGFRVLEAKDGFEGLSLLFEEEIDVVVLDLKMPRLDGFDFCRMVRSLPRTTGIPIIAVSALSDEGRVDEALEAGADDYLPKSLVTQELKGRISDLVKTGGIARGE